LAARRALRRSMRPPARATWTGEVGRAAVLGGGVEAGEGEEGDAAGLGLLGRKAGMSATSKDRRRGVAGQVVEGGPCPSAGVGAGEVGS